MKQDDTGIVTSVWYVNAMEKKSLFRIPNYPAWFGADTFLLAGSAVHWIVISVMAYELSGSVTVAGWFATARGVVSAITQITGGTFIDRHDHRTLILVQAGVCALLWLTMGTLFVTGHLTFAWFATLCLCSSSVFGFLGGTTNAALIRVVGPKRYAEAESVNQGRDAAVNTAGSPLGAALFGLSKAFPFFASALFDALAFICALFLRLPDDEAQQRSKTKDSSFVADTVDGWKWVLSSKTIVHAVLIIGIVQFGIFAVHQAVNLNLVERGIAPLLISLANVGTALGTIVGSLLSARLCNSVPVGKGVVMTLGLMSLAYVPMAVSSEYGFMLLSTFLASLPMPLFSALVNGFVFSKTPVTKQGRTRAAIMTSIMLIGSLSGAFAGEMLPRIGFSGFIACMMGLAGTGAILAALNPRIRTIPASPQWDEVDL
ncbi:MAG: MFS transporter [Atopobiaceae bacterium]|nr:MFS transporter [Atopobiaceae bacterium]